MLTEKQLNNLFVRGDSRLPHTHAEKFSCMPHATWQRQIASNLRVYKKLKNLSLSISLWGPASTGSWYNAGATPMPQLRPLSSMDRRHKLLQCRNVEPGHILIKLGFYMAAALLKSMRIVVQVVAVVVMIVVVVVVLLVVVAVTIVVGGLCCYFVLNAARTHLEFEFTFTYWLYSVCGI